MASLIFPDTTVLCNFAAVSRLDLLIEWLRGRGRWCEAVHAEALKSQRFWPSLVAVTAPGSPLGAPLTIDDPGLIGRIDSVRMHAFGGSSAEPTKHLGEAQTCVLIAESAEFAGSWWITDDVDAYEYAKGRHLTAYRTRDILHMIVSDGDLSPAEALAIIDAMLDAGRSVSRPNSSREFEQ